MKFARPQLAGTAYRLGDPEYRLVPILDELGHVPLLIGGDQHRRWDLPGTDEVGRPRSSHVLGIDGDAMTGPRSTKSQSAAYLALGWRCTATFRAGPGFHLLKSHHRRVAGS